MDLRCPICLSSFANQNDEISSSKCGHIFHYHCIVNWTQRSKTCPDCRAPLSRRNIFKLYLYSALRSSRPKNCPCFNIDSTNESKIGFMEKTEELKTTIAFLEMQLEEKTKTLEYLNQKFDDIEKSRKWELNQLNCQFVTYTNQSDQIRETLKCQIENLHRENSTIQTKVKNLEFELGKKTESYSDLLQKYHTLAKANEDELRRKDRKFVDYKIQSEINGDSLKSQIGKLRRETRSFRTKIGDLEWELDKKTKTHNDLLRELSNIEKSNQRESNEKDREFSIHQTRTERYIKLLKSKIENLRQRNNALRKIVKNINRKKKRVVRDSQLEANQLFDCKTKIKSLRDENNSLKREVEFLRLVI